jgi:4-carboxymuconolactone decarboxylase
LSTRSEGRSVAEHLPAIYRDLRKRYPDVLAAQDQLAAAVERSGPLDARTQRLVKLALAVGCLAEGAVRSNTRKALEHGVTAEEIEQVVLLAVTTRGFPAAVASWGWIREVLDARD